ncbi:Na(+)/H(+) antiporter nhaA 1 (Sodium/proton antiporter nhaA 1) [Legionella donaldsonii]|uniref:Na(+)/H(+) antiporter NhaA n=1 Tax=Legionella donaldsonii TaxID=45060 RepID=A0A378JA13_9GAMM|nr:Na+/H+ antiporter NhaA [Legionella donaldsonii]STX43978.1 Na(+)/H(+) antiporter nhaA 1 (Sodium/proton antiporter nhaA 1) [Legionella donaldsonii]
MSKKAHPKPRRTQVLAARAFASIEHFLHIEAVSGVLLLISAAIALIWANSQWADSYANIWHTSFAISLGGFEFSKSLHFWINDILMTFFFLVVGMEIRSELHEGALSKIKQAILPVIAALGGVIIPALIFLAFNFAPIQQTGWAVPTATDIAFAVGILALLGRSIPGEIRVFLLSLAIIDDIIAVLIIALFYSEGLNYLGFLTAGIGVLLVLGFQRIGIGSAWSYLIPGSLVWFGILMSGAHPTLAGVILGLMTPVRSKPMSEHPLDLLLRITGELTGRDIKLEKGHSQRRLLQKLQVAKRELLPPVVRVEQALHPWIAYIVMPLFALANAGINLSSSTYSASELLIITGIVVALVCGKPIGIVGISWVCIKLKWCHLPDGITWKGLWLVGLLAGIGFTMSIFIAMLAFKDMRFLNAAKLGVLLGSVTAAILGVIWGIIYLKQMTRINTKVH